MKNLGYFLLIAGFLLSAYSTALDVEATHWLMFAPAAVVAIIGVFLIKRHASGEATSESVLNANRMDLAKSLNNIVGSLEQMKGAGDSLSPTSLRDDIDGRLRGELRRFADARKSLIHLFGLQTYADIMSDFAAGERYINRVWSASADGYHGEAARYLDKAAVQFSAAQRQLSALSTQG